MKQATVPIIILLFASLAALSAFFHPDLFTAHDIWHQVARGFHYSSALKDGQFPPYFISSLANGFGYPLFFFSYHLPWLLGVPLLLLGISIQSSIKILFFISFFGSSLAMYAFLKEITKQKLASLVGAFLYLYAPYRFVIILVSAALGVSFVFLFLPLTFLGIHKIIHQKKFGGAILAISIPGIILSHLGSVIFIAPAIFLFVLFLRPSSNQLKQIIFFAAVGVGLSGFYILPALYYQKDILGFGTLYTKNFINFSQLVYSKWGYGIINNSAKEGAISFQLGIAQWLGLITALFFIRKNKIILAIFAGLVISIMGMLDTSRPLWSLVENFIKADYPTRFMTPALFCASTLAGFAIFALPKQLKIFFAAIFVAVAIYTNRNHVRVNQYLQIPVEAAVGSEVTTNTYHEYLPKGANLDLIFAPKVPAKNEIYTTRSYSFSVIAENSETIAINHFYQPYLHTFVDGNEVQVTKNEDGLIVLPPLTGEHKIDIKFVEPLIVNFGKFVTVICGIIILLGIKRNTLFLKPSKD